MHSQFLPQLKMIYYYYYFLYPSLLLRKIQTQLASTLFGAPVKLVPFLFLKADRESWSLPLCIFSHVLVSLYCLSPVPVSARLCFAIIPHFWSPSYSSLTVASRNSFLVKMFASLSIFISNISMVLILFLVTPAERSQLDISNSGLLAKGRKWFVTRMPKEHQVKTAHSK